jgi:hypothetical protein
LPEPKRFRIVSDAGIAATHRQIDYPLLVAPTTARTEKDFNTIRPSIYPVACWSCGDARFDFATSFVLPKIKEEIEHLQTIRDEAAEEDPVSGEKVHPRLSIFGHADPVGKDQDNKVLSGRRALAIYAMLIREPKIWENLYDSQAKGPYIGPTTYDKWGVKSIQIMLKELGLLGDLPSSGASAEDPADGKMGPHTKGAIEEFQRQKGLAVNGVADKTTREKLFLDYMDGLCGAFKLDKSEDFLAGGADKDLKGDLQGCGEFNPVLMFSEEDEKKYQKSGYKKERDEKNAPNRRVVIYLYWPGIKVDPQEWPCPSVKAGASACEGKKGTPDNFKRFWSDYQDRRKCRETQREFKDTMDTFACRIYQRQAQYSPCEEKIIGLPPFKVAVGVNYPWFNYGWDFGIDPWIQRVSYTGNVQPKPWGAPAGNEPVRAHLKRLKELGIRVVRWFILCDGMCYGTGEKSPRWNPQQEYWECTDPNDPDLRQDSAQIASNFRTLLEIFKSEDLQLLPSLIDFHWCYPGILVLRNEEYLVGGVKSKLPWPWLIKRGRYDILLNPDKRRAFLNTVLQSLLDVCRGFEDSIFAWEIINEPEWIMWEEHSNIWKPWRDKRSLLGDDAKKADLEAMRYAFLHPSLRGRHVYDPKRPGEPWPAEVRSHQIPAETMEAFVKEASHMINNYGFLATVGSASPSFRDGKNIDNGRYLQFWRDCGVNFIQFHDYENRGGLQKPGDIKVALGLQDFIEKDLKACFVGEFPTNWGKVGMSHSPGKDEADALEEVTKAYIKAAWLDGMTLVMPWRLRAAGADTDDATHWYSAEMALIELQTDGIVADFNQARELLHELTKSARP